MYDDRDGVDNDKENMPKAATLPPYFGKAKKKQMLVTFCNYKMQHDNRGREQDSTVKQNGNIKIYIFMYITCIYTLSRDIA